MRVRLPHYRGIEQMVARLAHNQQVAGSSPASATKIAKYEIYRIEGNPQPEH